MYIPRISTPLDIHGISMDIHVIYMVYSMYILEIGVPDVCLRLEYFDIYLEYVNPSISSANWGTIMTLL